MNRRNLAITGVAAVALALAWPTAAVAAQPTMISIVVADTTIIAGETSTVTFTFSEPVYGFDSTDIAVPNGAVDPAVASSDGGTVWTTTFTPTAGVEDGSNVITVDLSGVFDIATDTAGVGTADSNNFTIDTARPSAAIVVSNTPLAIGMTSTVTTTFTEAVSGLTGTDYTVPNGALTPPSSSDGGISWTSTFSPDPSVTDATNLITLDLTGVSDASGNSGTGIASSNNYAIDTVRPTATAVITDTTISVGATSTLTITFSEAVSGFDNADITVPNGTLSAVSTTDSGVTWTATYTPDGTISSGNVFVVNLAGVIDAAGNSGLATIDSNTFAVQAAATVQPADIIPVTGAEVGQLPIVALMLTGAGLGMLLVVRRWKSRQARLASTSSTR